MSDFLSNLLARSFADAPVVQPRLPSRFETGPAEPQAESQLFLESSTTAGSVSSFGGVASFPAESTSGSLANLLPTEKKLEAPTANRQNPDTPASQPPFETSAVEPGATRTSLSKPAKEFPPAEIHPVAVSRVERHFTQSNRIMTPATQAGQYGRPSVTTTPTINVTIGRVEVRAILPAARPVRPAAAPSPKLSLDAYLKSRNGGGA